MTLGDAALLCLLIFAAATLYSSVGHAGASGYLAAMALCGVDPAVMRPAALVLNVLVTAVATARFGRAGRFSFPLFWPFAAASVPFAALGGALDLPGRLSNPAVGGVLLFAAYLLLNAPDEGETGPEARPVPLPTALASGAAIELVSGLTGSGGSIFLGPLLLVMGWAGARDSAGVSAAFNLVNSLAGLVGMSMGLALLPEAVPLWAAAVAGGFLGAGLGSRYLGSHVLRRLLVTVLVVAGAKLVLT